MIAAALQLLFDHINSLWQGTNEWISPTAIFSAFVTAFNLRRTHRGLDLNFKEIMYGRIKMMTALCPAWAHTYQTMCLGFNPEQLKPEAFWLRVANLPKS